MLKRNFNEVAEQLYWNHPSIWVFSCKFTLYFQNTFSSKYLRRAASENGVFNRVIYSVTMQSFTFTCFNDFCCGLERVETSPSEGLFLLIMLWVILIKFCPWVANFYTNFLKLKWPLKNIFAHAWSNRFYD